MPARLEGPVLGKMQREKRKDEINLLDTYMKSPTLNIIIPCYNEETVLPITSVLFLEEVKLLINRKMIDDNSRIVFVNDGSTDSTWNIIKSLAQSDEHYYGLCLSRNRGHQNAVLAGLMDSKDKCDITISIDCDGQDDISAMGEMVDRYREGFDVVYGVRSKRDTDTFFSALLRRASIS